MSFVFREAVREAVPLLIGLVGPTFTGKTKSALRLAEGIQRVRGGKVVGLDTEANRMKHYAKEHKFLHCQFTPPFGSDRYGEAMIAAAKEAAGGVVIVDSMSHEHEGQGGYLEFHEEEVKRLMEHGGFRNEFAAQIPAWNKPVARRRRLINQVLQMDCAFIFCFRAKEKLKIQNGKDPVQLGWQAIAGEEFSFEMTVRCLLTPGCSGVPDWSEEAIRLGVPKRNTEHAALMTDGKPLDEHTGELLARWAAGDLDWQKALEQAATLEDLAATWGRIPKAEQSKYVAIKDARKQAIKPAAGAPI